jgi:P-type Cu+ transporter
MIEPNARANRGRRRVSAEVPCDYCQLPVAAPAGHDGEGVYCCYGCRLAAEITGASGEAGAARWTLVRLGLAVFLSINVMMFTMVLWTDQLYDARAAGSGPLAAALADLFRYLCLVLSLPVLWLLGVPLLENALAMRRRDVAAADLLIVLGVGAAYVFSAVSVWRGAGHVYFEVGCAVLVMVTLGRWLEATGKLRAMQSLDSLEKFLPDRVRTVAPDGGERSSPPEKIISGDLLRVLPGERIATDGRVTSGRAYVDQQLLTGESTPVSKRTGDAVLGGSLNLDGDLLVEVAAPVREGSLGRLIDLVRAARLTKGRYQRLADRAAGWFLSGVIVVAGLTFAFHAWRSGPDVGILTGLTVLLIACPCALGLATPMAVWAALGTASRHGVLFSHGEALEQLAAIRALRFDKTGTLTTGSPRVDQLVVDDPADRDDVLRRAARLADASTHVFSRAIVRFLDHPPGAPSHDANSAITSDDVVSSAGNGVAARFAGEAVATQLGSLRWLRASRLVVPRSLERALAPFDGESISAIGWGGRVRGVFVFRETLRSQASAALAQCKQLGFDVAVLTGDQPARAAVLADELLVPVLGGLSPQDKVAALDDARRRFGPVAMVGDGVNDAPALASSDLGIALGCGADVSRHSARVCLLADDLSRVPWAIALARRGVRIIRQNLFWAFAYNALGIGLAAAGWLNPAWAAAAMVVSSVFVVSNSLRLGAEPRTQPAGAAPAVKPEPAADHDQAAVAAPQTMVSVP